MKKLEKTFRKEDRVRAATAPAVCDRIDRRSENNVREFASEPEPFVSHRIGQLYHEWDVERYLEMNAATVGLTGLALGFLVSRKWLALSAVALGFLLQHALQGWCPPVSVLRRRGIRTRQEIEQERYALKALRGDFTLPNAPADERAARALAGARA